MKRRIVMATVVMAALMVAVMGVSGLMGAMSTSPVAADSGNLEFEWHAASGKSLDNLDCDQDAPADVGSPDGSFALCPDMATAANGETIEMIGSGTLRIHAKDGSPKKVDGGGAFDHTIDGDSFTGTWEAEQLLMFETYGPGGADFIAVDPTVRTAWRTGRALIMVHLVYDNGMEADAILEIGCRLPGNTTLIPGTLEGIRLLVGDGGLNFNDASDPRSTLFVDLNDDDDDDDDDD